MQIEQEDEQEYCKGGSARRLSSIEGGSVVSARATASSRNASVEAMWGAIKVA
jgi:hypothetical protein